MTNSFKTLLATGLVTVSMAATAPAVFAQDAPQGRRGPGIGERLRGPRGGVGPEFRFLNLSEDQQAQLRKIREARQNEFKATGEKLRAAREGMRQLLTADSINESAIRSKAAEVAAAEAEVAILNARVRQEALQILTADQQAKLKELRESRSTRTKQRRGPRG
jgi:Spy/CpxP family protein refolding chaperone